MDSLPKDIRDNLETYPLYGKLLLVLSDHSDTAPPDDKVFFEMLLGTMATFIAGAHEYVEKHMNDAEKYVTLTDDANTGKLYPALFDNERRLTTVQECDTVADIVRGQVNVLLTYVRNRIDENQSVSALAGDAGLSRLAEQTYVATRDAVQANIAGGDATVAATVTKKFCILWIDYWVKGCFDLLDDPEVMAVRHLASARVITAALYFAHRVWVFREFAGGTTMPLEVLATQTGFESVLAKASDRKNVAMLQHRENAEDSASVERKRASVDQLVALDQNISHDRGAHEARASRARLLARVEAWVFVGAFTGCLLLLLGMLQLSHTAQVASLAMLTIVVIILLYGEATLLMQHAP